MIRKYYIVKLKGYWRLFIKDKEKEIGKFKTLDQVIKKLSFMCWLEDLTTKKLKELTRQIKK